MYKLSFLFLGILISTLSFSQKYYPNKKHPKSVVEVANHRTEFWGKELGLSDVQKSQFRIAITEKILEVRGLKSVKDKELKSQVLEKAKDNYVEAIKKIFTQDQYRQYTYKKEKLKGSKDYHKGHQNKPKPKDDERVD